MYEAPESAAAAAFGPFVRENYDFRDSFVLPFVRSLETYPKISFSVNRISEFMSCATCAGIGDRVRRYGRGRSQNMGHSNSDSDPDTKSKEYNFLPIPSENSV